RASRRESKQRNAPDGFCDDRLAHLRRAGHAVDEDDRDLDDTQPQPLDAIGRLDLEDIAAGRDRVEVEPFEHLAAEALEAAGRVLDGHTQEEGGVDRASARDGAPQEPPVAGAAALDVARAQY